MDFQSETSVFAEPCFPISTESDRTMKKIFFCSVFFLLTVLNVWIFSSSIVVSPVFAAEDESDDSDFGFGDFGEDDSENTEDDSDAADGGFSLDGSDDSEISDSSDDPDDSDDFEDGGDDSDPDATDSDSASESSFLGSAESEKTDESEVSESKSSAGEKKKVSKPKANAVSFASNGKKAGDAAELTLHGVKYRFRWCPAGAFKMGSPMTETGRSLDEKQMDAIVPHGFWILETEVTVEMFASFVKASGYVTDAERDGQGGYRVDVESGHILGLDPAANWRFVGYRQEKNFPVTNVTWFDAAKFVEWINSEISTHEDPVDSKRQALLPTEMQWEYACRAGTDTVFSMGDRAEMLGKCANVREMNQNKKLMKSDLFKRNPWSLPYGMPFKYAAFVGASAPNAWGIFDMHGNVWEWCADGYGDYENVILPTESASQLEKWVGRLGPDLKKLKVMRGGGWNTNFLNARSAARGSNAPSRRFVDLGFRFIVLPMEKESLPDDVEEEDQDSGSSSVDALFGGVDEEESDDSDAGNDLDDEESGDEESDDEESDGDSADGESDDFGTNDESDDSDEEDSENDADDEGGFF